MNITSTFDLYFENKLPENEKLIFEEELRTNQDFYELYNQYVRVNRVIEKELNSPLLGDDDPNLKDLSTEQRLNIEHDVLRFQKIGKENESDKSNYSGTTGSGFTGKKSPIIEPGAQSENETGFRGFNDSTHIPKNLAGSGTLRILSGIAATILITLVIARLVNISGILTRNSLSPVQTFARYYNPSEDSELKSVDYNQFYSIKSSNENTRSEKNSEPEIIPESRILENDHELSLLFNGIICMEQNKYAQAEIFFRQILQNPLPIKKNTVEYYLGLSCLIQGELTEAKSIMQELSIKNSPYQREAKRILRSLDR
jgi:hypothetical protein